MDAQRASGAPLSIELGGKRRTFSRLGRRDVCALISQIPADSESERRWYTVFELQRWAPTPEGSVAVLAKASGEAADVVAEWGSEVSRLTAASTIVAESCLTGEEPDYNEKDMEGEYRPDFRGTTSTKRDTSQNTRRGWAILGRLLPPYGTRRLSESPNS